MAYGIRWTIAILATTLIIAMLGCPGNKKQEQNTANPSTGGESEVSVSGQPVSVPQEQLPEPAIQGSAGGEGEVNPPVTGYVPVPAQPLAPPAQPAAGVENVKQGSVQLVVSLKGSGDNAVPLVDGAEVGVQDKIEVQLSVVNLTAETFEATFPTSQRFDIIVKNMAGREVYKWSEGLRFAQVVNTFQVEAGNTWSHEMTVEIGTGEHQLRPGTYNFSVIMIDMPSMSVNAADVVIYKT